MFFLSSYDHFQRKLIIIAKSQGFFPWLFSLSWEQRKLGDCFSERVESMPDGELISVTINDGIKKFSELGRHDNSNEDKSKYKKVCVGDIAYNSMRMWQGASGYSPYEGIVSPAYTVLTPNSGIISKCLAYQFKLPEMTHTFQIHSQGITSDNWNLKYPTLSEIKIFVSPDEKEQEQIARFFTNLDDLITLHQHEPLFLVMLFSGGSCVFKSAWEQRKLKDICSVFTDGDWIESKDQSDQGVRLIQTGNVGVTEYLDKPNNKKWVSEDTFERLHCTEVLSGDILISRLPEPAGRACIVPKIGQKMITAVDCTIARIAPEYSSEYVVQYLSTQDYFDEVNNCLAGGTRQRISRGNLSSFLIPLPCSKAEQERIGGFFRSLDDLITLHQRKGNLREKKSLNFAWEQRKVSEVANRFDNLRIPVAANLRVSGTTPYYGANGIQDYVEGFTHEGEYVLVAEDGANDLKNYPVKCVNGRIWVNNHAHVLQGKPEIADNKFLAYSISQADIEALLVGGGRAKLNAEVMMGIEFYLPKLDEQRAIGNYLTSLDNLITLHQREHKSNFRRKTNVKQSTRDRPFLLLLCSVDKGLQRGSGP